MNLNLTIPLTGKSEATLSDVETRLNQVRNLMAKFGGYVADSCRLNGLPEFLLVGVLLIENHEADPAATSPAGAVGLAQIKPLSATDILVLARKKRLLTEPKKAVLRKRLGSRLDQVMTADLGRRIVTAADLKDPQFSVMLAGIYLSVLVAEHTTVDGDLRIDHVCARYNQGYYFYHVRKIAASTPFNVLLTKVPSECRSYLIKMLGKRGWADILI